MHTEMYYMNMYHLKINSAMNVHVPTTQVKKRNIIMRVSYAPCGPFHNYIPIPPPQRQPLPVFYVS